MVFVCKYCCTDTGAPKNYANSWVLCDGYMLGQHRTMGAAAFDGSFAPPAQFEKWEIHPVFPHFPNFRLGQNLSSKALDPLCGVALGIRSLSLCETFLKHFSLLFHNGKIAMLFGIMLTQIRHGRIAHFFQIAL